LCNEFDRLIYVFKNFIAGVAFPFLTLVIYLFEVLVAFLQAYIFTMLSALFIGMAVQEHEHEHHSSLIEIKFKQIF
jgi:F-type H+-transporting ATPase subunit a